MKKITHKFLDNELEVVGNQIRYRNAGRYVEEFWEEMKVYIKLLDLTYREFNPYIKDWIKKKNPKFNLRSLGNVKDYYIRSNMRPIIIAGYGLDKTSIFHRKGFLTINGKRLWNAICLNNAETRWFNQVFIKDY